jgi:hypothetical protein
MTTLDTPTRRYGGTPFGRIANVVRLQLGNPWTAVVLPWMILGFIFLGNIAVWILIGFGTDGQDARDAREGFSYSGASFYIFIYMMVVAIQSLNITFRFALGFGVTRRDYWLGSAVTWVIVAAMFSIGITILGLIERATDGWGLGGSMFAPIYYGEEWWQRLLVVFIALLFFLFFGALLGAIYVRWKALGVIVFFAALVILGIVVIAVAIQPAVSAWWGLVSLSLAPPTALGIAVWLLIPTALSAVLGFFILRRATARA